MAVASSVGPFFTSEMVDVVPTSGTLPEVDSWDFSQGSGGGAFALPLAFGAEDDPDRALVEEWVKVDDFGGYADVFAGVACGKMFLRFGGSESGNSAFCAATTERGLNGGSVVAEGAPGGGHARRPGTPDLGFMPCPMSGRGALLCPGGAWRSDLSWDFMASVTLLKDPAGTWRGGSLWYNADCVTMWVVVVGNYVCFYSTKTALKDRRGGTCQYSYYLNLMTGRRGPEYTVDDYSAINRRMGRDWLEADLPWMQDGAREVSANTDPDCPGEISTRYGMASMDSQTAYHSSCCMPQLICPRYHTAQLWWPGFRYFDQNIAHRLEDLNARFCYTPDLIEARGTAHPIGMGEGELGWTSPDCTDFVVIASSSLPSAAWSTQLKLYAAHVGGRVLTASVCMQLDVEWPEGEDDDEEEGYTEDEGGGGGGGGDGDDTQDDDHLDPDKPTGEVTLPDGYIYEGGTDISVTRTQAIHNGAPGYNFDIGSGATPTATLGVIYDIVLSVTTENSPDLYDWISVFGEYRDLQMFFGVSGSGSAVAVSWKSSWAGPDNLPKSCSPHVSTPQQNATARAYFDDSFGATSETAPGAFSSNILTFTHVGDITKRGVMRVYDPTIKRKRSQRWVRTFHRYRVDLLTGKLRQIMQEMLAVNAPTASAAVSPSTLAGSSSANGSGIGGPNVSASVAAISVRDTGRTAGMDAEITGPLVPRVTGSWPQGQASVSVSGSSNWNNMGDGTHAGHGEISGAFVVTVPATYIQDLCNNTQ